MAQSKRKQARAAADGGERKAGRRRIDRPATIEDRLVAKAEAADRTDYSDRRSLGQMSREERHRILFGE